MHGTTIDPEAASQAPGLALHRFAAGARWRHVRGSALGSMFRVLLALAVPAVLLLWWLPWLRRDVLIVGFAILLPVVACSAVRAWWRGRGILLALGRSIAGEGAELAAVRDELATWFELEARGSEASFDRGMLRWLERDVMARLRPHQKRALAAIARPRVGRWRWLLPVVILLLVVWFLAEWLAPPWPGAVGGRNNQPTAGGGADGQGGGGAPSSGAGDGEPEQQPEQPEPQPGAGQQQPTVPEGPPPEPVDPEPPAPLLDLPDQRRFVVPEFIGDGPTRRARVRAAELEQEAGSAQATSRPQPQPGDPERAPPPPSAVEFERAAEAAQRARHVPPAEQAMVRRFFERLQQAKR